MHYFVSNIRSLLIYTGEIKQILENELQIPVSKMLLKGWKTGDVEDSVSFFTFIFLFFSYSSHLVLFCSSFRYTAILLSYTLQSGSPIFQVPTWPHIV